MVPDSLIACVCPCSSIGGGGRRGAQAAEKQRSEIDNEALALSLSTTSAYFCFFLVFMTFFVLRSSTAPVNFAGSTIASCAIVFYLAARSK